MRGKKGEKKNINFKCQAAGEHRAYVELKRKTTTMKIITVSISGSGGKNGVEKLETVNNHMF